MSVAVICDDHAMRFAIRARSPYFVSLRSDCGGMMTVGRIDRAPAGKWPKEIMDLWHSIPRKANEPG